MVLYGVTAGNKDGSALFLAQKGREMSVNAFLCAEHFACL